MGLTSTKTVRHSSRWLSPPLSLEILGTREDLAKVAVLSVVDGFINVTSILEVAPSIINKPLAGPITLINACAFLVLLVSRVEVKEVCKMGTFKVIAKNGPGSLKLVPWSAKVQREELLARGNGSLFGIFCFTGCAGALLQRCCD